MRLPVFTLGHSTRNLEDFLALLTEHGVEVLADVRNFPGSRRFPHFRRETLAAALAEAGIDYRHLPGLGGRRKGRSDSRHTYWTNAGFRAYADHMETAEFQSAFADLLAIADDRTTALMCAEAVHWRCHRQLVADALVAGGRRVVHILAPGRTDDHALNPSARVLPDGTVDLRRWSRPAGGAVRLTPGTGSAARRWPEPAINPYSIGSPVGVGATAKRSRHR